MNLSEIKQILAGGNICLSKALGQNFLHDANQLRRILASADVAPGDRILEIGPGLGALTQPLLAGGAHVLAIEKDRRLHDFLAKRYAGHPRLTLLHADALAYLRDHPSEWLECKMVSNLPYSIASPIMVELAQATTPPAKLVVTLQLEVARRLQASAGDEDYGLLTLLVQVRYAVSHWFRIPSTCFFPAPEIDSACVTLERRPAVLLSSEQRLVFERVVKRGFSQRRKMMAKLLKADWPDTQIARAYQELNLAPAVRAETVTLEQFISLARLLTRQIL